MDIVQILIFIGVIFFVTIKKYKEGSDNRPKQKGHVQEPAEGTDDMEMEEAEMPPYMPEETQTIMPDLNQDEQTSQTDTAKPGQKQPAILITPEGKMIVLGPQMKDNPLERFDRTAPQRKEPMEKKNTQTEHDMKPPGRKNEKISMNHPADARRAFIYSEIFNRKY